MDGWVGGWVGGGQREVTQRGWGGREMEDLRRELESVRKTAEKQVTWDSPSLPPHGVTHRGR